jgi:hypothetical protein
VTRQKPGAGFIVFAVVTVILVALMVGFLFALRG